MNTRLATALAIPLTMVGLLAAGMLGTAHAANQDQEATVLRGAKVSLIQAITTAERQTGGQAFDAGVNTKAGRARIAVETNGSKGVQTVTIDAQNGQVVATHAGGEPD